MLARAFCLNGGHLPMPFRADVYLKANIVAGRVHIMYMASRDSKVVVRCSYAAAENNTNLMGFGRMISLSCSSLLVLYSWTMAIIAARMCHHEYGLFRSLWLLYALVSQVSYTINELDRNDVWAFKRSAT